MGRDWTAPYHGWWTPAPNSCRAALIDGEVIVQDENGISDFDALRSAIHKAPHRIVFFAFDLLHLDGQDLRRTPLIERRAALRKLIEPDLRSRFSSPYHPKNILIAALGSNQREEILERGTAHIEA